MMSEMNNDYSIDLLTALTNSESQWNIHALLSKSHIGCGLQNHIYKWFAEMKQVKR